MSKVNLFVANLLILICIFWLNSSHLTAEPCQDCPGPTSTITGTVNCNQNWILEWDYDNTTSDAISKNSSITIAVKGGSPPYAWSLIQTSTQGRGFYLNEETTLESTNTLSTGGVPCGTAWVQVRDRCGKEVIETFIYPDLGSGRWKNKSHGQCVLSERYNSVDWSNMPRFGYQYGGRYQEQVITIAGGKWGRCPGGGTCDDWADEPHELNDCLQTGLIPCIDYDIPVMYECVATHSLTYKEWECIE
jgi:hypothetical protein